LFTGLAIALTLVAVFGDAIRAHYFGDSSAFRHTTGELAVHTIDVGHGDAIAIRFPCDRVALIDAGDVGYTGRISDYLRRRVTGRRGRIDWVVLTHPHLDHMGGMTEILNNFDIGVVYRPLISSQSTHDTNNGTVTFMGGETPHPVYTDVIYATYANAEDVRISTAGTYFGTPYWRMFFHTPTVDGTWAGMRHANMNEMSPIMTLEFGNQIFVFTGDAGFMAEGDFLLTDTARYMFGTGRRDRTVHLNVGHHGSNGSTGNDFLRLIQPTTASISVGTRFETLPSATAINRIRGNGVTRENLFITADSGAIAIVTDGNTWNVHVGFRNPPNLWWLFSLLIIGLWFACFFDWKRAHN